MSTQQKLIELLSSRLGIPQDSIAAESSFLDNLKMDSLDKFDIIVEASDEFGFDPETAVWENIRTVGELAVFIDEAKSQ